LAWWLVASWSVVGVLLRGSDSSRELLCVWCRRVLACLALAGGASCGWRPWSLSCQKTPIVEEGTPRGQQLPQNFWGVPPHWL